MLVTTTVPYSVQQRKLFFERLSLHEKDEKPRPPLMLSKSTPASPEERLNLFNVPPKKPKRTFEHDIYMETKLCTSAPCSSRCSSCSPEEASIMSRRLINTKVCN
ncbi:unnamed protein product, partial [Mesorhabditis belari]|uniref:Uncharacterized protein n=1 Tax=Mesorhabditis belari TaxID=2138241 RepID=A0AAF3FPW4_9BILA